MCPSVFVKLIFTYCFSTNFSETSGTCVYYKSHLKKKVFLIFFFFFFAIQTYRQERYQESAPYVGSASKIRQRPLLGQFEALSLDLHPGLPCMCRVPSKRAQLPCSPRRISRELFQKWKNHRLNLALQLAALPTVPPWWLQWFLT